MRLNDSILLNAICTGHMDWKKKYTHLQEILNQSRENLKDISGRLEYEYQLDLLEKEYQQKIKGFSPAYLSGSQWYVGPSIKKHIQEQMSSPGQMDMGLFSFLCVASRQSEKEDTKKFQS